MPIWQEPYPVLLKHCEVFKEEIYCQSDIGALRELSDDKIEECKLSLPCFEVPKKNRSIQLLINICLLNKVLKSKEYPLLNFDKIFKDIWVFTFVLVIDLNVGYLSIPFTEKMQKSSWLSWCSVSSNVVYSWWESSQPPTSPSQAWSVSSNQWQSTSLTHALTASSIVREQT